MKYPYASPNLRIRDVIASSLTTGDCAEKKLQAYFSKLTGKKYILITNSCRTALFLAYKALDKTGEVITSPLTCKVAVDPITESGNTPQFADIRIGDLNINPDDVLHRITPETIAIQAIHFGGNSCEMDQINEIAKSNNLAVVEDCAQSLGALYKNQPTGSYGDISCFSLIKNAYGIGGGIFATNNYDYFLKAKKNQKELGKSSRKIILYRLARNTIDTKRQHQTGRLLFKLLALLKGEKTSYSNIQNQLFKPVGTEVRIASHQIQRLQYLHKKRKELGKLYFRHLKNAGLLINHKYDDCRSSFTKFFIYNPQIKARELLPELHKSGIEAMHLEQKQGSPFQEKLIDQNCLKSKRLINYESVHDSVISLPLSENLTEQDIKNIVSTIRSAIYKK